METLKDLSSAAASTTDAFFVMPVCKERFSVLRCSRTLKYAALPCSKITLFATA